MAQLSQESEFDKKLARIGELYENGKDELNNIRLGFLPQQERQSITELFKIIQELRDIAAVTLVSNHKITEN